ncbi:MAG: hypothetical protein KIT48_12145 [Pseudolabrys sp.]|nr:hypothetical protein [Pseudolabrys sp.]
MFVPGKWYTWTMLEGPLETIGSISVQVIEVALPLVKIKEAGREKIINTSAPTFVSAQLDERR